jgi:hypothetical protein
MCLNYRMGKLRRTVRKSKKRQNGGAAPVSFSTPFNQRQPTEAIMEWATTAGIPTQSGPQMRNVAHGGGTRRVHRKHKGKGTRRNKRTRRN